MLQITFTAIFVKHNWPLTLSQGVSDCVVTPAKTNLHVPLRQWFKLQLLLLYCLVCSEIIKRASCAAIGSRTQSRRAQATDGVMQAVDFCYSTNMSMIRSLCPPGTISSCSAMDSCKGSDILRLIPAGRCSPHPIFFYLYIRIPILSCIIRQCVFRVLRPLSVDSVQIILIHSKKQCFSLSDEIMVLVCSHTLVTE